MSSIDVNFINAIATESFFANFAGKDRCMPEREATLFVGLGGMGRRTLVEIKDRYDQNYKDDGKVSFLAVDFDPEIKKDGFEPVELPEVNSGFLTVDIESLLSALDNPPESFASWCPLSRKKALQRNGATEADRQLGRFIFCATSLFENMKDAVADICRQYIESGAKKIHIFLVSGLCGSMGGGSFADAAYLINSVIKKITAASVDLYGVFYTPDVLEQSVGTTSHYAQKLFANAYAALKELNYFMGFGKDSPLADKYSPELLDSGDEPIFKPGRVMLVSEFDDDDNMGETVQKTAQMLLEITSGLDGAKSSLLASFLGWNVDLFTTAAVKGKIPQKEQDILKTAPLVFQLADYVSPSYREFEGFGDGLCAYCADGLLKRVADMWADNRKRIDVNEIIKSCGLDCIESIVNKIKNEIFGTKTPITVKIPVYPETKNFFVRKEAQISSVRRDTKEILNNTFAVLNKKFTESVAQMWAQNIKSMLRDKFASRQNLVTIGAGNIRDILRLCRENMENIFADTDALHTAYKALGQKKEQLLSDLTKRVFVPRSMVEEFFDVCIRSAEAMLDMEIWQRVLQKFIPEVLNAIDELDCEFKGLDEIVSAVRNDNSKKANQFVCNTRTYKSVYGLCDREGNADRFFGFVDRWISQINVSRLCWGEADCLYIYEYPGGKPNLVIAAQLFARMFECTVAPLIKRQEGLIYVAFDDKNKIRRVRDIEEFLSPNTLTSIKEERNRIEVRIYEYFVEQYQKSSCRGFIHPHGNELYNVISCVFVPAGWKNIRDILRSVEKNVAVFSHGWGDSIAFVKTEAALEIYRHFSVLKWAGAYAASDTAELHLDFGKSEWKIYLPEICGADVCEFYKSLGMDAHMADALALSDKAVYERIADALDYCTKKGLIVKKGTPHKVKYTALECYEGLKSLQSMSDSIRAFLEKEALADSDAPTLVYLINQIAQARVNGTFCAARQFDNVDVLCDDNIAPERKIRNIHRLIRSDVRYTNIIQDTMKIKQLADDIGGVV